MSQSAVVCAVCRQSRIDGSQNRVGDMFICARCQADATQFIEIQDSIWGEEDTDGASTSDTDKPAHC